MGILRKNKKYWNIKPILEKKARYNMIFGERSNGKSYGVLEEGLRRYFQDGSEIAIIRRWDTDFKGKNGQQMFENLMHNGNGENMVEKLSNGEFTNIVYYSSRWYLAKWDSEKKNRLIRSEEPFAYAFALTNSEHDKSTSYPRIRTVLFDEFMSRFGYLPDEFILFMNVLSTIIRDRNDVTIFMCGNTINKYCPYFDEMGLKHVKNMKQGDIELYTYGNSDLKVAVEFSDSPNKNKASNVYFAFDNPKLSMITGEGNVWEIAIYPHSPCKWIPKEILFTYFIQFDGTLLQCEIIAHEDLIFTYVHQKTSELKDTKNDLIYTPDYNPRPNYRRNVLKPTLPLEQKIANFYRTDKIFYQDNEIGEVMRNYLQWCKTDRGIL